MHTARPFIASGILLGLLSGCRAHAPVSVAAPPATTQEACQQIRDFFKKYNAASDAPIEMSAGCHMRLNAGDRVGGLLNRQLEANGWKHDAISYDTPSTHCAIEKLEAHSGSGGVGVGIGVGGGSHLPTNFGIGIGIGSGQEGRVDYKIDCLPKKTTL